MRGVVSHAPCPVGVPAHDDRDAQFVASTNGTLGSVEVLTSEGSVLVNSGKVIN